MRLGEIYEFDFSKYKVKYVVTGTSILGYKLQRVKPATTKADFNRFPPTIHLNIHLKSK